MNKMKVYIDDIPDPSYVERFRQLGVGQYCIGYQNTLDPNCHTGTIDVDKVIETIESGRNIGGGCSFKDAEYVVLDFEFPFMKPLSVGTEYVSGDITYESIKNTLVKTITILRGKYMDKKFGFYSMPSVPGYIAADGDPIPQSMTGVQGTYLNKASKTQQDKLRKHLSYSFGPLANASDFVTVSIYQIDKRDEDVIGLDGIDRSRAEIGAKVCSNLAAGEKRSFAWVAPVYFSFANKTGVNANYSVFDLIPFDEVMSESVIPAMRNGCDGFFVWLASNYRIQQITTPLNEGGVAAMRDWFNKNFLAGTGASGADDAYWTAPHMVSAIKTIMTDWLYRFCKRIVEGLEVAPTIDKV